MPRVCVYVCVCARARARVCVHVCMHVCMHVYTHTHMRVYTHTHTHTCISQVFRICPATLKDALVMSVSRVSFEMAIEEARRSLEGPEESNERQSHPWGEARRKLALVREAAAAAAEDVEGDEVDMDRLEVCVWLPPQIECVLL